MSEDRLISCLTALCGRFATDPLKGRYEVANKAGLSEQYLYQVLAGKPMENGNKRSIGKVAMAKISRAYPDWLNIAHHPEPAAQRVEQPCQAYEARPNHPRALVQQVCELAERLDDAGLLKLHGYAACLLADHPLAKAKPPLSA